VRRPAWSAIAGLHWKVCLLRENGVAAQTFPLRRLICAVVVADLALLIGCASGAGA
jgi:hypothetical protein